MILQAVGIHQRPFEPFHIVDTGTYDASTVRQNLIP